MDERLARQARNEGLTRTVNERVATLDARAGSWAAAEQMFDFHCECGKVEGCSNRVRMTLAEYAKVRLQTDRFAVVPGHETDEIEVVVARDERSSSLTSSTTTSRSWAATAQAEAELSRRPRAAASGG